MMVTKDPTGTECPGKRALLIAGPTASGKSAVALSLAEQHGGVIINADAMQVYKELEILSARPARADLARAEHQIYGHVPAATRYSVGKWLADARQALNRAWAQGRLPIVVGGTGLYFKALLDGLAPVPDIPQAVRDKVAGWYREDGEAGLRARLPAAEEAPADHQRLIRAVEVLEATGQPLSSWRGQAISPVLSGIKVGKVYLSLDRQELYGRAEKRFDQMLAAGALGEVEALHDLALDPEMPAMKAIGVKELSAHLRGEMHLADAADAAKTQTRRYIKRQLTWYRGQMRDWPEAAPQGAAKALLASLGPA